MVSGTGLEKAINYAAEYGLQIKTGEEWEIAVYWNGHWVDAVPDRYFTRLCDLMAAIDRARETVKCWILDGEEIREIEEE